MVSLRFSDIMISVNRWLSAVDPRRPILVRTESTCDSRTRSWERSSKRGAVTTWSRVAGLRFQSGFETSWSLMPARSSESRSRVRLFVTSPAGPRTGNDGGLQRRSVELRDGEANPRSRNHDATRVSSSHTKVQTFSPHLLRLTFRRLPSVASGRSQDGESSAFNRAGSTLAEAGFGLENGVHPRRIGTSIGSAEREGSKNRWSWAWRKGLGGGIGGFPARRLCFDVDTGGSKGVEAQEHWESTGSGRVLQRGGIAEEGLGRGWQSF
jgi:hypothetical protein